MAELWLMLKVWAITIALFLLSAPGFAYLLRNKPDWVQVSLGGWLAMVIFIAVNISMAFSSRR